MIAPHQCPLGPGGTRHEFAVLRKDVVDEGDSVSFDVRVNGFENVAAIEITFDKQSLLHECPCRPGCKRAKVCNTLGIGGGLKWRRRRQVANCLSDNGVENMSVVEK